jgi:hypothetical protein
VLIELILEFNPGHFLQPSMFNLMFPFTMSFFESNRINGAQVEALHEKGPQFDVKDV